MILVTGGTGFIGRALIQYLVAEGREVRTLVRPASESPELPKGVPVEIAISSITDERSLRAALVGVDTVYHLVGGEWLGTSADLQAIEAQGTLNLVNEAKDAGVKRIFYVSHIGADRGSAYAVLKVKGIAEQHIINSGINYTILRSGLVFGPDDHFTTAIARLTRFFPFIFPMPGDGSVMVHPLWVEDLVTCLAWALDNPETVNQVYEVGGPEALPFTEVLQAVMAVTGQSKRLWGVRPSNMRLAGVFLEYLFPNLPLSVYWVDYLAGNRTASLDTIPRVFGLMPRRFVHHLDYLIDTGTSGSRLSKLLRRNRESTS
ncbi:MAG: NAD-dependent epimerase/dehydratase family protein [Chloroflexi bacterium]|nr:MAG: NAD-dependent epimerase/dehydratase family protein [Chloroflexota bacterium]MBL1193487.1 NAD-dependent epimerase/dehydratase family protein [Chloroflexota bacterium]NOH10778.1 NAD(P)H-binding protein [Chloroflexota bacterium]